MVSRLFVGWPGLYHKCQVLALQDSGSLRASVRNAAWGNRLEARYPIRVICLSHRT